MAVTTGPKIAVMDGAALGDLYLTQGNNMLRMLQALLQGNVISILSTPPVSPANGDTYIVGAAATGAWVGKDNQIAYWTTDDPNNPTGVWDFYIPKTGWMVYLVSDGLFYYWNGATWVSSGVPTAPGGGIPTYDINGNSPTAQNNHIVTAGGVFSTGVNGFGHYDITLTGVAAFSDGNSYTAIATANISPLINIPLEVERVSGTVVRVFNHALNVTNINAVPGGNITITFTADADAIAPLLSVGMLLKMEGLLSFTFANGVGLTINGVAGNTITAPWNAVFPSFSGADSGTAYICKNGLAFFCTCVGVKTGGVV